MSEKEAGWYPDPAGENRQRFWDGDHWTEYYTPLAPQQVAVHGAATAAQDYPYLVDAHAGAHHGVMVQPGTTGTGWPTGTALPGGSGPRPGGWPTSGGSSNPGGWPNAGGADANLAVPGTAPTGGWAGAQPRPANGETMVFTAGKRRGPGMILGIVAAAVLLLLVVAGIGWWITEGGNDPQADPTGPQTPSGPGNPSPGAGPVTTGTVTVDGTSDGEIAASGSYEATLDVTEETVAVFDAISSATTTDLEMTITDAAGTVIAESDDRGRELTPLGGTALDPWVVATLPPGEYVVTIREHNAAAADVNLAVTGLPEPLALDESTTGELGENTPWVGTVDIPAAGEYSIDVQDQANGDPALVAISPSGRVLVQDDRDYAGGDFDPLLSEQLDEGRYVLVVTEWNSNPTTVSLTVSAN